MSGKRMAKLLSVIVMNLALLSPAFAQGMKQKLSGLIVKQEADSFVLRADTGTEQRVKFTPATEIREKKKNPFRGAKRYGSDDLVRGLKVEVEGRSDDSAALVAEKIRFTNDDLEMAETIESRVIPVGTRTTTTEGRVTEAARRLADIADSTVAGMCTRK